MFPIFKREAETPTLLDPLETASLSHWTTKLDCITEHSMQYVVKKWVYNVYETSFQYLLLVRHHLGSNCVGLSEVNYNMMSL